MGRVRIAAAVPVASVLVAVAIVATLLAVPDTTVPPAGASPRNAVIAAAGELTAALQVRPEELADPPAGEPGTSADPTGRPPGSPRRTEQAGDAGRGRGGDSAAYSPPPPSPPAGEAGDRQQIVAALRQLLTALEVRPEELADPPAGEPGGATDADDTITIADFAFGPELTVQPGATVRVVNTDSASHNVTAADGAFATETLASGASATFTAPATPGRYAFRCTLHPEMSGALVVADRQPGAGR